MGCMTVWTIGHGTRMTEDLIRALQACGVTRLVDVRTVPRSHHNPQFNRDRLPSALAAVGIAYSHIPQLGGLRRPQRDSVNGAWRNASFRGYADHMQTNDFRAGIADLLALAAGQPTAIMCAELVPWRCHRSLIADALVARGVDVQHILEPGRVNAHTLTAWARAEGDRVTYPGSEPDRDLFGERPEAEGQ